MMLPAVPALPQPAPRFASLAGKLFYRSPAVVARNWRKYQLRARYLRGAANRARELPIEDFDPAIVDTGRRLRQQVLASNERKHAAAGYRVLMLRPGAITAEIWFGDLAQCMRHAGIDCHVLPPGASTAAINAAFESFQPNVFIATESVDALRIIDLPFVLGYKRSQGCLRLFIPVWHANTPRQNVPGRYSTARQDEWRRRLRTQGLTADAHFSIFEPEFHERFARDPQGPAIEYVTIPQGCNPFNDYPVPEPKRHDYFMAASMTDDRVEVCHRFLRPVLGNYRGVWAGPNWGFGLRGIRPIEMAHYYAQARIALSPLVAFVHTYGAELTHRVYATAACGAFQLTMPTAITGRYFRPDELVQAASPAEYALLFDHYVDRPLARNAVALAALRRAYGEHTCFHRIDSLVRHWDEWRRRGLF